MFGDLFDEEEDFSFLSNSTTSDGKKTKRKDSEILEPRGETGLSGLRNQGGTCYLNSLLQTLLFTPEFREALFALSPEELGSLEDKDVEDSKVRIIPLQLQRLFAQLLLVDQQAASTADLTSSFGWDNNERRSRQPPARLSPNPARATAYCLQRDPYHETSTPAVWRETNPADEDFGILHEVNPLQAATTDNRRHH
ncbi:PREDICTED: ubiquitin carboxyl-terminal hydrolase 40-like [Nanorana parkeri]|uniref:ubiquitin carboxyl-terminal hydrolase 40-like n=1 Tax=Nanorana parkeri TaxID=125878 RepID=UPI0008545CEF|nr:PREDICTED: ubiquitin carboxyl-terminal hydrolase 40-like [Nanorana parkeri]